MLIPRNTIQRLTSGSQSNIYSLTTWQCSTCTKFRKKLLFVQKKWTFMTEHVKVVLTYVP